MHPFGPRIVQPGDLDRGFWATCQSEGVRGKPVCGRGFLYSVNVCKFKNV